MTKSKLPDIELFSRLTDQERRYFEKNGDWVQTEKDQSILKVNASNDRLWVLIDGIIHISLDTDRRRKFLCKLKTGDVIGENAFLNQDGKANANVDAQSDCILWQLRKTRFDYFRDEWSVEGCNAFLLGLGSVMMEKLSRANVRFQLFSDVQPKTKSGDNCQDLFDQTGFGNTNREWRKSVDKRAERFAPPIRTDICTASSPESFPWPLEMHHPGFRYGRSIFLVKDRSSDEGRTPRCELDPILRPPGADL